MACVARDALHPGEVPAIDIGHHLDHPSRRPFCRCRVGYKIGLVRSGVRMTVGTIKTQRGGDDAHAREKIVDAEFLERAGCDILEGLACLFIRGDGYLSLCSGESRQCRDGKRELPPELHLDSSKKKWPQKGTKSTKSFMCSCASLWL